MIDSCDAQLSGISFNQDSSCFACGVGATFVVYNSDPLKTVQKQEVGGGVQCVAMLFRCNCLALVGGGDHPMFPANYVVIWDDAAKGVSAQIDNETQVLGVRLRRDRVVVMSASAVKVFTFTRPPALLHNCPTQPNPQGVCALASDSDATCLAYPAPGDSAGCVELRSLYAFDDPAACRRIHAHNSQLAQLSLTPDGLLLATASIKGTIIRLFCTKTGVRLSELRRGTHPATVYCISFSSSREFVCAVSSRGTAHVWGVADSFKRSQQTLVAFSGNGKCDESDHSNGHKSSGKLGGILPRKAASSFLRIQLPNSKFYASGVRANYSICAFGADSSSLIVVSADGVYCKYGFTKDGHCTRDNYARLDTV